MSAEGPRAALALIARYGDDDATIAVLRAAELAAVGDVDGLAQWDEIIAFILLREKDGRGGLAHRAHSSSNGGGSRPAWNRITGFSS